MNQRLIPKASFPAVQLSMTLAAAAFLLTIASSSASAQTSGAQPTVATPSAQPVPVEPCRMLLGGRGIGLLTRSGAKCQAGAPLMLSAMHVDGPTQRLCDFNKAIVKTKAESIQDTDSVQCIFNGSPLPGDIPVYYGRIVGNKVVEITE